MDAVADFEPHAKTASRLLKALGNEHRLMIVVHLLDGEMTVGALERRIGISQSALSQHLARLRRENLVKTRREAQLIHYSLSGEGAKAVVGTLASLFGTDRAASAPLQVAV